MNDATELDQELAELDALLAVIEKRRVEVVNQITSRELAATEQLTRFRRVLSLVPAARPRAGVTRSDQEPALSHPATSSPRTTGSAVLSRDSNTALGASAGSAGTEPARLTMEDGTFEEDTDLLPDLARARR